MKIRNPEIIENVRNETMKLLKIKGCNGWNMEELAKNSRLSKDTLYRLIGSKQQWLTNILEFRINENKQEIQSIVQKDFDFENKLELIISSITQFVLEISSENILGVFKQYPEISDTLMQIRRDIDERIIEFIGRGVSDGYFISELEPEFLYEMINANILYFSTTNPVNSLEQKMNKVFKYLLRGVRNV